MNAAQLAIEAVVVFKPGAAAGEDELRAHTAGFVTRFKIPSRFVAQAELPKNAVGKIMKREVRASLAWNYCSLRDSAA